MQRSHRRTAGKKIHAATPELPGAQVPEDVGPQEVEDERVGKVLLESSGLAGATRAEQEEALVW